MSSGPELRLIFALHNHQPIGNFDRVYAAAYKDSYLPFLDVLEDYPDVPFVLHTSGPLLEWLVENRPEYVARVRALAEAGRVEILGGGYYEPILTMIPRRDRVGQVRDYSAFLSETFGVEVRGAWVAERVWEQNLASSLAVAGVEYTVLDDCHFHRAGLPDESLDGYYLTEDEGRLLKVFPGSERLRYLTPFHEPHECYEHLRRLADRRPGATVVCADDGEKFGSWPGTAEHVYRRGWLRRFCDLLSGNRHWLRTTTLAEAVDATLPLGKVYLPDGSYREMTEWALTTTRLLEYRQARKAGAGEPAADRLRPFAHAGGSWRNFKAKYPESDAMYCRMLGISRRLSALEDGDGADPDYLEAARRDLYKGQCNCAYWHGSFGGLYLPHLRAAVYRHLIAAEVALDEAEGLEGPRVSLDVADFNLDDRQEARLANDHLTAFVRPADGGQLDELDVRRALVNVLATLDRRPEPYHVAIAEAGTGAAVGADPGEGPVVWKQAGLDRLIRYDRHPRKALVDHFWPADLTLDRLLDGPDVELGDFVRGAYLARVRREPGRVVLAMERTGRAGPHRVRVEKTVTLEAGLPALLVHYRLEGLPEGRPIHFGVECNVASMAGNADGRSYLDASGLRIGPLDARLDRRGQTGLTLTDSWLDLSVALRWSEPAALWCHPVETVSRSEGGFEAVYQSSAVIPHWLVTADASGLWEVRIEWVVGPAVSPREEPVAGRARLVAVLDAET